jgi:hypothetical protein
MKKTLESARLAATQNFEEAESTRQRLGDESRKVNLEMESFALDYLYWLNILDWNIPTE